jgi:membrane protein insertase Oxa1/YidC/SpoIIIJ
MTFVNIISSYIYAANLGKNDKVQLWMLALLFLVLLYNSPSALVFYWTLNNIFSLVKNYISVNVLKMKSLV